MGKYYTLPDGTITSSLDDVIEEQKSGYLEGYRD